MQNNRLTVTRCRRAGVGSTTFTLAHMTVAMLLHMVLGDDMDIFVLLVYWALHCDLQGDLAIQMEKWDGIILKTMPHAQNVGAPYAHSCF